MSEEDFELELANWQDPIVTALHAICLPFVLPREAYYLSRFAFKWMVKDRSSYVLREEGRAKWNARAKHEKMLQRTAIYMANEWTCNRRPVCNCFNSTESGGLTELIEKHYFPARNHKNHLLVEYVQWRKDYWARKWFGSGTRIQVKEWKEAHARAIGQASLGVDVKLDVFEQIFQRADAEMGRPACTP